MKTVLSNAKKYLSVLLAMAMIVLSIPNAPVTVLAATGNDSATESIEPAEGTEVASEAEPASSEEVVEPASSEEVAEPAPVADQVTVDTAAQGTGDVQVDTASVGATTYAAYAVATANDDPQGAAVSSVSNNVIYLAIGGEGELLAYVTDNGGSRISDPTEEGLIPYTFSDGGFTTEDTDIVSIEADPDGRAGKAVVKGLKPGVATVAGTFTDGSGNTYDTEKGYAATIVVYGMVATAGNEKYASYKSEDQEGEMFFNNISDNNWDGTLQLPISGNLKFAFTTGNGTGSETATWNAVTVNGGEKPAAEIVVPDDSATAANKIYRAKGSGEVKVTATFVPSGAVTGDEITLTSGVAVANIQTNIIATESVSGKEIVNTITNNGTACLNPTGNAWEASQEVESGSSVSYTLKAVDAYGNDETSYVTFVPDYDSEDDKRDYTLAGNTLTLTGTKYSADNSHKLSIFAKNSDDVILGILKVKWEVVDNADFKFVSHNDGATALDSGKKYAILPKSDITGNGSGVVSTNLAVLATPTAITATTNWSPTANDIVSSNTYTEGKYASDTKEHARVYGASENTVYGDQVVTVKRADKDVTDSYLIRVVDASVDGKKPMEVSDQKYQVTLNIAFVSNNQKLDVTRNAYDAEGVITATANEGSIIYGSADGSVSNNTAYADSKTLTVLGGGSGTVTIDTASIITSATDNGGILGGYYKAGTKEIKGVTYPVAGVINVNGGTITAAAPGKASFMATYTDGDMKWNFPVEVVVQEIRDSIGATAEVTTNGNDEAAPTIAAGQSVVFESSVSSNNKKVDGLTYVYTIKGISQNGKALVDTNPDDVAKINAILKNAVITEDKLQTTKNKDAFDVDTELTIETTASLVSATGVEIKEVGTTTNTVTVSAASKTDIAFKDSSTVYLGVNGVGVARAISGNVGGTKLVTSTNPEKVTSVTVNAAYDSITLNGVNPGTATVSVGIDGVTGDPITLSTVVYGIETNDNLVLSDNGKEYDLHIAKYGDVYDNDIQINVTNGSKVTNGNTWQVTGTGLKISQDGVLTITGNPTSGKVTVKHVDRPEGQDPIATTLTINIKIHENFVILTSNDGGASRDMDYTTKDAEQFILRPTGIYEYYDATEKETVTANGFGGAILSANASSDKFVKLERNEDNTFTITPVGVGTTTVTLNAFYEGEDVTKSNGEAVYTINVNTVPTLKKQGTTVAQSVGAASSATMNAFTNFAVTNVNEKGLAIDWSADPTLQEAIQYNEEGTSFNDGWEWEVPTRKISTLANAKASGDTVTATANYTIAGNVVTTNTITITPYTIDGLVLEKGNTAWSDKETLVETEPGIYNARLGTKGNNLQVDVEPVVFKLNESVSESTAPSLWYEYPTLNVTSSRTDLVGPVVDKTRDSFKINTSTSSGTGKITVLANGLFEAEINATVASEDEMTTLWWTNVSGTVTSNDKAELTSATALKKSGNHVINLSNTVQRDSFYIAVPVSDVTGNIIKTDENARGDIYVSSSAPDVVELGGSLMNQVGVSTNMFGTGKDGYIYTMDLTAKKAGQSVIKVVASDEAETTLQFTLNVVDGKDPVFEEVTLSNAKKSNTASLNASFDDAWFISGVTGNNAEGLSVTTASILGDATGYFTATSSNISWQSTVDPTKLATGDYNVTLKGTSALAYQDSADKYVGASASTLTADYTGIPLIIHVTDREMITPSIANVTIKQGVAGQDLNITGVDTKYDIKDVTIKDADLEAAATAGITISGTTISASKTAVPGKYEFHVTVEADNVDPTKVGAVGDATVSILVEESDAPVPYVNDGVINLVRGDSVALNAIWSDDQTRTNTFTLDTVAGFSISDGRLVADSKASIGTTSLRINVVGTDADGKEIKGIANVQVTVVKFDPNVALSSASLSVSLGKTATLSVSNPNKYDVTNYQFDAASKTIVGSAVTLSTDGVITATTDETKVDSYSGLTILVDVSNGTDTIEGLALPGLTINVRKSGADQHTDEKPEDASDEMTVNYIMPDLTYDGTAKTLQNLQVFWNGKLLILNKDYSVKYANNKNVGTGTCTITGKGSYQQAMTIKMPIVARDISEGGDFEGEFTAESVTVKSADKVSSAKIKLYWNGKAMKATGNTPEYTAQIGTYVEADGRAEVTIKGVGNFTGEKTAYVYVLGSNKDAKTLTVSFTKKANEMVVGKGGTMYPAFTVKGGGSQKFAPDFVDSTSGQVPKEGTITVAEGKTIEYHFEGGDRAGKSYLVIEVQEPTQIGTQTYLGNKTQVYTIKSDMKFTKDNVKLATPEADLYYNGLAKTVEVEIKDGDEMLDEGVDYVITYRNNIKAGNATATVTGLGAYAGNKYNLTFKILKPTVVLKLWGDTAPITKGGATPSCSISLMNGDTEVDMLSSYYGATDWTYSYKNNKTVGETATMTVKGKANVQGTSSATYKVTEAEFNYDVWPYSTVQDVKYTEKALADIKAGKKNPKITLYGKNLTINRDYTVESWDFSSDTWDAETGYIDVDVTIKGAGDYTGTATLRAFHIYAGDAAHKISTKNWKVKETLVYPDEALSVEDIDAGDMEGKYTILPTKLFGKPNAKSATYTITVRGEGAYGGTATFRYQVLPADIHAAE